MARLGTDTGSLVNYMAMNSQNKVTPEVGMGVTFLHWSDRSPGTIQKVETIKGKLYITITGDDYKRIDDNGMSECQEYEYTPRPDGHKVVYRFNEKKGKWEQVIFNQETKRWKVKNGYTAIALGYREHYYDFSF